MGMQSGAGSETELEMASSEDSRFRWVKRLFQLWGIHAYLDLMLLTRDLKTFLTYYISDTILIMASVTGMLFLAQRFNGIGIWTREQVIFMLGYAMTVSSLVGVFFNYNVAFISRRIGRGQLDHILMQPNPLWMALLTEGFLPFASTGMILPGLVMMAWASARLPQPLHGGAGLIALNLFSSLSIVMAFAFLWGSLAFWEPRAAEEINSATYRLLDHLKPFPLDGVKGPARTTLMTALPVGFVAWYPCRALLGLDGWSGSVYLTPLVALLLLSLAAGAFRLGLRRYAETGSSRYLSFGHRR